MLRVLLALVLATLSLDAAAQRPPLVVPDDPATVLERLPEGYAELMPRAGDAPASLERIEALLRTAARTGDARLVARAEGELARFPQGDNAPAALRARAYVAQYRHDFEKAREWLDRLVAIAPRDGDALLARAQMSLVQGRLDEARADCSALAFGVDSGRGLLCVAALSQRRGEAEAAARLLDRWLALAATGDPDALRFALVMRAEAASHAGDADADEWFRRALELAPDDVRTLAAYVRHLRGDGRAAEAFVLLPENPVSEHLQLERALAAQAAGLSQAPALIEALARLYRRAHAIGAEPDLRDEAEFLLTLRDDSAAALPLAQRNFDSQRDREDVDLLRRAAAAAGRPEALAQLRAWAVSQSLELPATGAGEDEA